MIINNKDVLNVFEKDAERNYCDIIDLNITSSESSIIYFSNNKASFLNYDYVKLRIFDDDCLIDIFTKSINLIDEAIMHAKSFNKAKIYLAVVDKDIIPLISSSFRVVKSDDSSYGDFGVYGTLKDGYNFNEKCDSVVISECNDDDVEKISLLPSDEWVFLPQRIKYMKDTLLIAKKDDEYSGYLVYYTNGYDKYSDIVMIFVHTDYRNNGIGTLLINSFVNLCSENELIPYYGVAGSEESALLAEKCNFKKIKEHTDVYEVIFDK